MLHLQNLGKCLQLSLLVSENINNDRYYCIDALKLKRSMIQELSAILCICMIYTYIVHAMNNNGAYWSEYVNI